MAFHSTQLEHLYSIKFALIKRSLNLVMLEYVEFSTIISSKEYLVLSDVLYLRNVRNLYCSQLSNLLIL